MFCLKYLTDLKTLFQFFFSLVIAYIHNEVYESRKSNLIKYCTDICCYISECIFRMIASRNQDYCIFLTLMNHRLPRVTSQYTYFFLFVQFFTSSAIKAPMSTNGSMLVELARCHFSKSFMALNTCICIC